MLQNIFLSPILWYGLIVLTVLFFMPIGGVINILVGGVCLIVGVICIFKAHFGMLDVDS